MDVDHHPHHPHHPHSLPPLPPLPPPPAPVAAALPDEALPPGLRALATGLGQPPQGSRKNKRATDEELAHLQLILAQERERERLSRSSTSSGSSAPSTPAFHLFPPGSAASVDSAVALNSPLSAGIHALSIHGQPDDFPGNHAARSMSSSVSPRASVAPAPAARSIAPRPAPAAATTAAASAATATEHADPPTAADHHHQDPVPQQAPASAPSSSTRRVPPPDPHAAAHSSTNAPKKRPRTVLTPLQTCVLRRVLATTAFPSTQLRQILARELDLHPRTIQIWFQNQRQKFKASRASAGAQPIAFLEVKSPQACRFAALYAAYDDAGSPSSVGGTAPAASGSVEPMDTSSSPAVVSAPPPTTTTTASIPPGFMDTSRRSRPSMAARRKAPPAPISVPSIAWVPANPPRSDHVSTPASATAPTSLVIPPPPHTAPLPPHPLPSRMYHHHQYAAAPLSATFHHHGSDPAAACHSPEPWTPIEMPLTAGGVRSGSAATALDMLAAAAAAIARTSSSASEPHPYASVSASPESTPFMSSSATSSGAGTMHYNNYHAHPPPYAPDSARGSPVFWSHAPASSARHPHTYPYPHHNHHPYARPPPVHAATAPVTPSMTPLVDSAGVLAPPRSATLAPPPAPPTTSRTASPLILPRPITPASTSATPFIPTAVVVSGSDLPTPLLEPRIGWDHYHAHARSASGAATPTWPRFAMPPPLASCAFLGAVVAPGGAGHGTPNNAAAAAIAAERGPVLTPLSIGGGADGAAVAPAAEGSEEAAVPAGSKNTELPPLASLALNAA
ncbi:hypothetical protein H9P43_005275 [Blastocladiella emersonii ATCC 22665]|nr:hypothetical protein H9P43_005275 [Blastocladiella emersonii ATCC 22665]